MASGFRTNSEYRRYMTSNGLQMMNDNLRHACDNAHARAFDFAVSPQSTSIHPSHFFASIFDDSQPVGYEANATKAKYLDEYRQEASTTTQDMSRLFGFRY